MGITLEQAQKEIQTLRDELSAIFAQPKYTRTHWLTGKSKGVLSEDQESRVKEIEEMITSYSILSGMIIADQMKKQ